ncbi:MAG: phage tail protein [Blastocatellia bacterium]|nr:phage tail protein [Blastocatellia bacterium]
MPRRENDPFASFNFLLEIDGIVKAGFSECSVSSSESNVIEYREGNEAITARKLPGLNKFGNVTLKRGISQDMDVFNWWKAVRDGDIVRDESMSVVLLNEKREEVVRWNLINAWPCKWMGPDLKANANEIAIESLEICHEGLERQ